MPDLTVGIFGFVGMFAVVPGLTEDIAVSIACEVVTPVVIQGTSLPEAFSIVVR